MRAKEIVEDGGRWAMIVDYAPHADASNAFDALVRACVEHDVVCEGAWGPRSDGEPGRAYLAVSNELDDSELMQRLRGASLPCELVQIHPEPMIKPRPKAIVKRAAEIEGRSVSDFVVTAAQAAARQTIEHSSVIRLSVEDQRVMMDAILSPAEPNEALRKAREAHQRIVAAR